MKCLELTKYLEHRAKIPQQYPEMCSQVVSSLLKVTFWYLPTSARHLFSFWPAPTDGFSPRTFFPAVSMPARAWRGGLQPSHAKAAVPAAQRGGRRASATCLLDPVPPPAVPTWPTLWQPTLRRDPVTLNSDTWVCEFCTSQMEIILPACQITILIRNFLWRHRFYKLPPDLQTWAKRTAPSQNTIWERN